MPSSSWHWLLSYQIDLLPEVALSMPDEVVQKQEEVNRLVRSLAHFVPVSAWFDAPERSKVFVKAFHVFRVRFEDFPPPPSATVLDFELVRAVFVKGSLLYPDYEASWQVHPRGRWRLGF
jgi:hypothetical protein